MYHLCFMLFLQKKLEIWFYIGTFCFLFEEGKTNALEWHTSQNNFEKQLLQ